MQTLSVSNDAAECRVELIGILPSSEWMPQREIAAALLPLFTKEALVDALRSLDKDGLLERQQQDTGYIYRRKTAVPETDQDKTGATSSLLHGTAASLESFLRKCEERGKVTVPRTYFRGREKAWHKDREDRGDIGEMAKIPEELRARFLADALVYIKDNGKGGASRHDSPLGAENTALRLYLRWLHEKEEEEMTPEQRIERDYKARQMNRVKMEAIVTPIATQVPDATLFEENESEEYEDAF